MYEDSFYEDPFFRLYYYNISVKSGALNSYIYRFYVFNAKGVNELNLSCSLKEKSKAI